MKRYLFDYLYLFTISAFVVFLDQWTKSLVRTNLGLNEMWSPWPWLMPYARIVHWHNSGAAFGMLQGFSGIFTILPFLVAVAIVYYFPRVPREDWLIRLALSLQLGGAIGNLVDRLNQGGLVTDFISVGNFPVFNVADASVTVGTALLILGMWLNERKLKLSPVENDSDVTTNPPNSPVQEEISGE